MFDIRRRYGARRNFPQTKAATEWKSVSHLSRSECDAIYLSPEVCYHRALCSANISSGWISLVPLIAVASPWAEVHIFENCSIFFVSPLAVHAAQRCRCMRSFATENKTIWTTSSISSAVFASSHPNAAEIADFGQKSWMNVHFSSLIWSHPIYYFARRMIMMPDDIPHLCNLFARFY